MQKQLQIVLILALCWSAGAGAVDKPTSLTSTCITVECHSSYGQKKYPHGPVALGDCKPCHRSKDEAEHTFEIELKGKELCSFCHLEQTVEKNLHEPLKTGDCTGCHDPHGTDYKFLIPVPKVSDLCLNCHEETTKDMKFLHGPIAAGECTLCHNSHSAEYDHLLNMAPENLCNFCHETTQDELNRLEFVHQPVKEGCLTCHDVHGGANAMILKKQAPELCYPCHEDIQKIVQNAKYQHSVVNEIDGCTNCHTPHASSVRFGLKADPMTLCITCHDKPLEVSKDKTIPNFKSEIENKKYLHGPVSQKDCRGCHISHGSDHFRLLVKDYPSGFYAPFNVKNYELCFSCHQETLVLTKETDELTDFRNGKSNLHFLHVNKPEKGRSCRTCHSTHASDSPKHIRASVPYGKWEIPIQFAKNDTGGSCAPGCHMPRKYDRIKPETYLTVEEIQNNPPADPNSVVQ
jgi:predicted CXXCH cytochrome family protein